MKSHLYTEIFKTRKETRSMTNYANKVT